MSDTNSGAQILVVGSDSRYLVDFFRSHPSMKENNISFTLVPSIGACTGKPPLAVVLDFLPNKLSALPERDVRAAERLKAPVLALVPRTMEWAAYRGSCVFFTEMEVPEVRTHLVSLARTPLPQLVMAND